MSRDSRRITNKSARILFLAWGFSIHAKRRISIFIEDPAFEVAVVSTHNYNFPNARNYLLHAIDSDVKPFGKRIFRILINKIKVFWLNCLFLLSHFFFSDIKNWFVDFKILLSLLISKEIRSEKFTALSDYKILKSAIRDFAPDVIFLQTLLYPCYLAYFLPKSIPVIITFWNGDVIWWAKWKGIERLIKKQIVTYGVHIAQAITVNSQKAFDACLDYGVGKDKIHLIPYPGVDLKRFCPLSKEDARKKLCITVRKVVLSPRGLGSYLNTDVILESVLKVLKKKSDTLFLFLGGDEVEAKKHQKIAHDLGIEGNCRWEGNVPWEKMNLYYASSDVMVSISSKDSLPNCMLEAMGCGIPVIMGDIPQIRDWIIDGTNGFLVDPRDPDLLSEKIIEMLDDNGNAGRFAKYNIDVVRREMDSEKNIAKVKEIVWNVV